MKMVARAFESAVVWLARMLDGEDVPDAPRQAQMSLQTFVAVLRAIELDQPHGYPATRLDDRLPKVGGLSWDEWEIVAARADAAVERCDG